MSWLDLVIQHEGNSVHKGLIMQTLQSLLICVEFVDHGSSLLRACLIIYPDHLMHLTATQQAQCALSWLDLGIRHDGIIVYKVRT